MGSSTTDRRLGLVGDKGMKAPVALATTANITLSGEQSIDGVATSSSRVLVKNQTTATENGIYVSNTGAWTRDLDANGNLDLVTGTMVCVTGGSTQSRSFWQITTLGTITIGSTSITWAICLTAATISAYMTTVLGASTAAAARTLLDAMSPEDLQAQTYTSFTTGGTSTAFTLTPTPALAALASGQEFDVTFNAAPGASPTLAISGLSAKSLKYRDPSGTKQTVSSTQVPSGWRTRVVYDGTDYIVREIASSVTLISKIQPISATVAANAMTISLEPTSLDFRSTTLGSGAVTTVTNSSTISVVISSGSTAGTTSAVKSGIWVAAINNAGTMELAWSNGTPVDETGIISTTAEGGAGAADSSNVWYSTTARTNVAYRIVGRVDSTQATAGTWATAPSLVQGAGGFALLGTLIAYTRFTASGTWTRAAGTTKAMYRLKGGGGNGGAGDTTSIGGGGGGEGQERTYFDTSPPSSGAVTVGAAASSSSVVGSITVTAIGGVTGSSVLGTGGAGGTRGGAGGLAKVGMAGLDQSAATGGNGGGSDSGAGGLGVNGTAATANTGCGGGGGGITNTGGAGATGVVEIWEYA